MRISPTAVAMLLSAAASYPVGWFVGTAIHRPQVWRQQVELVCDSYEKQGDDIVCHGEGLPDVRVGHGSMGWAQDPDHPGSWYQFVLGYSDPDVQLDYRGSRGDSPVTPTPCCSCPEQSLTGCATVTD